MVFFSCDACNESLKKNQVQTHTYRCRSDAYSCIDCQQVFTRTSYAQHVKCISENEKYGGKGYVAKENKGEAKQNAWCDQVERAIDAVPDGQLKDLLKNIQGYSNIPRKEAKFINFLSNSLRIRSKDLCVKAWKAIAEEAAKIKAEEEEEEKKKKEEEKEKEDEKKEEEKEIVDEVTTISTPFKWKATIKRKLKEAGGEMKVKKLRKVVMEEFISSRGEEEEVDGGIFEEKLQKAGITLEGKVASLVK